MSFSLCNSSLHIHKQILGESKNSGCKSAIIPTATPGATIFHSVPFSHSLHRQLLLLSPQNSRSPPTLTLSSLDPARSTGLCPPQLTCVRHSAGAGKMFASQRGPQHSPAVAWVPWPWDKVSLPRDSWPCHAGPLCDVQSLIYDITERESESERIMEGL